MKRNTLSSTIFLNRGSQSKNSNISNITSKSNGPKIISTEILPTNFAHRCGKNRWILGKKLKKSFNRCAQNVQKKELQFCIDCFLSNYFGLNFHKILGLRETAMKFKNSIVQNLDSNDFQINIHTTEIPLFNCTQKPFQSNIVASCKKHIFSPPKNSCSICFWINWLKH